MSFSKIAKIGVGVTIDDSVVFDNSLEVIEIGDHSYLGPNVRITGREFRLGEYSKIHRDTYINAKKFVSLGACTWIGQGSHLDGTGGIAAGDFLGVGINSALYSHIRHGDTMEGCRFERDGELTIGDDVWFVGMCLVSPVKVGNKSMALLGSVVTRDMEENSIYGGNPATNLTHKMGNPWKELTVEEKTQRFRVLKNEFFKDNIQMDSDKIQIEEEATSLESGVTYYSLTHRTYTKTNSLEEVSFNKSIFAYKAKFRAKRNQT